MKKTDARATEIRNRDRLIARLGDSFDAYARKIADAMGRPRDEAQAELRRLIRSLKETAREVRWIGSGRLDAPRRRRIDLPAAIRDIVSDWREPLERCGSIVHVEAVPAKIVDRWDRTHVEVIVGELLSNALKHGAGKPLSIRIKADARSAVVVFEDSGRGPLPRRPFERFVRGSTATGDGMGVGLWLVDALAKKNGGQLRFARGPRGNTRAVVRLRRPGRARD